MAFDSNTRNKLQKMVAACRKLLTEEFEDQLQERFGIYPGEGKLLSLEKLAVQDDETLGVARLLRSRIEHLMAGDAMNLADAVRRVLREQAFTVLNRFAALRMAEERDLIPESVRGGTTSKGAQVFADLAGPALGDTYERYRVYLDRLFDELSRDLRVLFDRFSPFGLLFPGEKALTDLLAAINAPDLTPLWGEDETIGWIYQYFNDPEERRKMRKDSAAPRNSRELAVRNQFFTPRYVVEFLTDNTLGRLWYEMTRGETVLRDRCRFLVRHPTEIFLQPGEAPPSDSDNPQSQEAILLQPVHIPHRPMKDPREIRLLDPACGSMHFGLYAFDLFSEIYREAWDDGHCPSLRQDYKSREKFLVDVPRLIIEHNIHGIDIDPRAAQIAGLSLWLRAQRAWKEQGVAPLDRPTIKKSNIVCAEPMPGDGRLLGEFADSLQPRFLGQIVRQVWDSMQLAGEAGSLLKIEEEIADWVKAAKNQWQAMPQDEQISLFESPGKYGRKQEELSLDLSGITDAAFWEEAEQRIYQALRDSVESVGDEAYQRRLFAEDAARGFAFIDLCRLRYDVALMNPPFGDASLPSKPYIEETYGDTKGDVYKAFVECFQARLVPAGYLGIISSRTGFFLSGSEDWRTRVVLRLFRPIALADLGMGVLDAMVEVAAYVLRSLSAPEARDLTHSIVPVLGKVVRDSQDRFSLPKWQAARGGLKRHQAVAELEHLEAHGFVQRSSSETVRYTPLWHSVKKVTARPKPAFPPLVCIRALAEDDKGAALAETIGGDSKRRMYVCSPSSFTAVPGHPFAYWASQNLLRLFGDLVRKGDFPTRNGLSTCDDFRFVRLFGEIESGEIESGRWRPFAKGGAYSPFYADIPTLVTWGAMQPELEAFGAIKGNAARSKQSSEFYFRPGLTWPLRAKAFSPQAMPTGCIFSVRGYAMFAPDSELAPLLGLAASSVFDYLFKLLLGRFGFPEFVVGVLDVLPIPGLSNRVGEALGVLACRAWATKRSLDTSTSTSHAFVCPPLLTTPGITLAERATAWAVHARTSEETVATIQAEIDDLSFRLYGLDAADRAALTSTLATETTGEVETYAAEEEDDEAATADAPALAADLLAYTLGCAIGRWDIRYATGERPAPPAPDPFDPLPVCPPGMLQNAAGLPAAPGDVPPRYPVRIIWSGLLVDDPTHLEDIEHRVREVLAVLFPDRADAIADEACALLGVKSLREWFRKPAGFFADHLKRYSKSRRQAPIYWPLSTASGRYTLWVYYHHLTDQTLFECITGFVKPKIEEVESDLTRLRNDQAPRERIDDMVEFLAELTAFRDELLRVAAHPWKPNLNDGVLITASPLWKLFRLPKWQKDLKACWEKLEKGDYDWAHLAYTIWPDRVKRVCETDRSIAIAHGLEHLCKVELPKAKSKRGKKAEKQSNADLLEE